VPLAAGAIFFFFFFFFFCFFFFFLRADVAGGTPLDVIYSQWLC